MANDPGRLGAVLLVEDDPDVRFLLETLLRPLAGELVVAVCGLSGAEAAQGRRYDLVVCDVHMPHRSGLELCEEIRAASPESQIVLVSGFLSETQRARATTIGARILPKPFGAKELRAAVGVS